MLTMQITFCKHKAMTKKFALIVQYEEDCCCDQLNKRLPNLKISENNEEESSSPKTKSTLID